MRYVVTFAHKKYAHILESVCFGSADYQIPEGLHRQLAVVVDAESADEAIVKAGASLGWPDVEMDLAPTGAVSQDEIRRMLTPQRKPAAPVA